MATLFSYWTKSVYSFTLCIALPCCSNATLAQLVLVRWVVNDCRLRARYVIFVHTSYTCVCGVVGAEGAEWKTYYIYIKSIRAKPNVSEYRKRITYIACCLCWYYLSVHRSNKKKYIRCTYIPAHLETNHYITIFLWLCCTCKRLSGGSVFVSELAQHWSLIAVVCHDFERHHGTSNEWFVSRHGQQQQRSVRVTIHASAQKVQLLAWHLQQGQELHSGPNTAQLG